MAVNAAPTSTLIMNNNEIVGLFERITPLAARFLTKVRFRFNIISGHAVHLLVILFFFGTDNSCRFGSVSM